MPLGALLFCKTKVDKDSSLLCVVVEEIGWFDITMQNACSVYAVESAEEALEVVTHVVDHKVTVVESEVEMAKVRQDSDYLVMMSEGSKQRADVRRISQGM